MQTDPARLDRDDLTQRLKRTFSAPSYRPPSLPAAALEILQPGAAARRLLFPGGPGLGAGPGPRRPGGFGGPVGGLLRPLPIQTLHQAAVRLGVKGMRDLVLEAALNLKVFRAPGHDAAMAQLARHSSATAHVARAVCQRTRVEAENAFLCGLLHDVGFAACTLSLSEDPTLRCTPFRELAHLIDDLHVEASALLTRAWSLPPAIQRLVATHHEVQVDGRREPLNAALIVAEQLCWEAGAGLEPPPPDASPTRTTLPEPPLEGIDANWTGMVEEARETLGLTPLALCALRAEAFDIVERLLAPART